MQSKHPPCFTTDPVQEIENILFKYVTGDIYEAAPPTPTFIHTTNGLWIKWVKYIELYQNFYQRDQKI